MTRHQIAQKRRRCVPQLPFLFRKNLPLVGRLERFRAAIAVAATAGIAPIAGPTVCCLSVGLQKMRKMPVFTYLYEKRCCHSANFKNVALRINEMQPIVTKGEIRDKYFKLFNGAATSRRRCFAARLLEHPKTRTSRNVACGISTMKEEDHDQHFKAHKQEWRNDLASDR
ncbi:hypothetical protein PQQ99_01110 [Paraburkholderia sediminicola]|uniref:hypothetical protein n=1 Tax=Paraburkholderia sediminicola TaxID=458836 RepID=UPI0038B7A031